MFSPRATSDHDDLGLQPERTALALDRTCLVMIAVQLLLARAALDHDPLLVRLSLGSLVVPLVLLIVAQLRHRGVVERFVADRVSRQFVRHMTLAAYVVWTCCLGLALTQT